MSRLRFSDGVELDTNGPLRVERRRDGFYVLGNGMSIPVESREEGASIIAEAAGEERAEDEDEDDIEVDVDYGDPDDEPAVVHPSTCAWFIYIPEEGDWPIRPMTKSGREPADKVAATRAYLDWAKRKTLPRGSRIWKRGGAS